jgi:hypothetical protein
VKRGEAARQELSPSVRDEEGLAVDAADQGFGGIRWSQDARGRRVLDLYLVPGPALLAQPDVLLYWAPGPTRREPAEIQDLPEDAALLGALGQDAVHRFLVPEAVRDDSGNLVLYSAAHHSGLFLLPMPGGAPTSAGAPR